MAMDGKHAFKRACWCRTKAGRQAFRRFFKLPFTERPPMQKIRVVIVSPALADANNSNSQTARRWLKTAAFSSTTLVHHSG